MRILSSYNAFLNSKTTKIRRNAILELFGGMENFLIYHDLNKADAYARRNELNF
jgi:hypothetical protein